MTSKLNRCYWTAASAGTGSFVYDATVPKHLSPANAEAVDGATYAVIAENDADSEWEISIGVYDSGTGTITRDTIVESSNGGAAVDFTAAPKVRMGVPLAADFTVAPEKIAGADFGATPAASFSFDLDVTLHAGIRVIVDGVRVDTAMFNNDDFVEGLYVTVLDSGASQIAQFQVSNGLIAEKTDQGAGYVIHELVPIQNGYLVSASINGMNLYCPFSVKDEYVEGVFQQQANDLDTGNSGIYSSPETEITVVIAPLLNGSDPINMIAGTITVIGTRK
jgi:hypothetical protein